MGRTATINRNTNETKISVTVNLDGTGASEIYTGIGFFDHMLTLFSKHSFIDLKVKTEGDLFVDGHHSVEDTGIVLGQAIREALGDKAGITRYGNFLLPMDETLVLCAIDLCGRPYLGYDLSLTTPVIGGLDTQLVREFFYAVSYTLGASIHLKQMSGLNDHHIAEASFKAFGRALSQAISYSPREKGIPSTKGVI
ncbi:MAG: imidazoleglycerol-phosphate dehydratase HisB [Lachnospiraceae bacterium]|nr:imidazoleglycerol-phosphate dehydratase HisB [Lachnospiraceae bacterium]